MIKTRGASLLRKAVDKACQTSTRIVKGTVTEPICREMHGFIHLRLPRVSIEGNPVDCNRHGGPCRMVRKRAVLGRDVRPLDEVNFINEGLELCRQFVLAKNQSIESYGPNEAPVARACKMKPVLTGLVHELVRNPCRPFGKDHLPFRILLVKHESTASIRSYQGGPDVEAIMNLLLTEPRWNGYTCGVESRRPEVKRFPL